MNKNDDEKFIREYLEELGVPEDKILEKIKISKKLNKGEEKKLKHYKEKIKNKKDKEFAILQEWIKRKASGKNQYVPLKDYIIKLQRINLRSTNKTKQKHLDLANSFKNTIYFPTIVSKKADVEWKVKFLKEWEYWAIQLDPQKINAKYLSIWFNENIPKAQIKGVGSGSTIPNITKNDLEKLKIINHSLSEQKQIIENIKTAYELELKAAQLRQANVFNATHLSIDDIIKNIPDLELAHLLEKEESVQHELKSSLRYDLKKNKLVEANNDVLINPILKTIVAFLNTEGGHLLVGIEEVHNGENIVRGIEIDEFKSQDEWHRYLKDKIKSRIDIKYLENNIKVEFKKIDEKTLAIIKVAALNKKEHALLDESKIFERKGPSNEELPIKKIGEWVLSRVEKVL